MINLLSTSVASLNKNIPQSQWQKAAGAIAATPLPPTDSVSISESARKLLTAESSGNGEPNYAKLLSDSVHQDPALAEKLADEMSHGTYAAWLDFSDSIKGTGPVKYAATGQPVTEESESYFNSMGSAVLENKIKIYETEKAKGTPAADIVDKLLGYMDSLPTSYKEMINWKGSHTV
ncbi:hypothetical protein EGT07_02205 [Herbaspirillum sp. HC18]|nr:hypothetical protein EGT07_02205 [Herbaspirillum sp. HC18]